MPSSFGFQTGNKHNSNFYACLVDSSQQGKIRSLSGLEKEGDAANLLI
ncbi:hypothetical protein P10159_3524 [Citrobacter portucalensis]|nr:hypothetical protein P10159_3524 [Citrobacter portucalensis]